MAEEEKHGEDYIEIKIPNQELPQEEEKVSQRKEEKQEKKPIKPVKKKNSKKKTAKKPAAKKEKKPAAKKESQGNNWLWAILLIIGLLVIASVIYLSLQPKEVEEIKEKKVAALVNNQPIYVSEVTDIYEKLPPEVTSTMTEEDVLNQLIEQELLLQEAEAHNYKVTDEELTAYLDELKTFFGMDDVQLNAALAAQDMTREEFEKNSRRQILVNDYINDTIYNKIIVTDEEIAARYEKEKQFFLMPETSVVKHILIVPEANETDDATQARAEEVSAMIEDDFSNFCDLVTEYTADSASIATCGEYQITATSNFVVEFKTEGLAMAVDEIKIVQTEHGYHIMLKTAQKEAGYLSVEEVSADIEQVIKQEQSSLLITQFINELRDKATIEKYPLNADKEVETAPLTVEEEVKQEEKVEAVIEKTKPVREGDFGNCLEEQQAVLYGVSWSPDVIEQQELLGEAFAEVNYVDCDPADGNTPAACDSITVYPTWIIGDQILQGLQSMNALERETGCQA